MNVDLRPLAVLPTVALGAVGVDLATKHWAHAHRPVAAASHRGPVVSLVDAPDRRSMRGLASGASPAATWLPAVVGVLVAGCAGVAATRLGGSAALALAASGGLVAGGIAGNVLDRRDDGVVTNGFRLAVPAGTVAFNAADVAIYGGAVGAVGAITAAALLR